jgi:hypothetical protein
LPLESLNPVMIEAEVIKKRRFEVMAKTAMIRLRSPQVSQCQRFSAYEGLKGLEE